MATPTNDYTLQAKPYANPEKHKRHERGESRGVILHQEQKAELKATISRSQESDKKPTTSLQALREEQLKQAEKERAYFVETVKDGDTVVNESGGRQSHVSARMDLIPPLNQLLLGECLGFGANKYGENNWHLISQQENLNHALVHILKWLDGDRSEPHLVNALARVNFALYHAIKEGDQPPQYIHPDMLKNDDPDQTESSSD